MQLSSYTSEPWRFNELFSTDTKVIIGTSQVGSGELQGKLQRTEADQLGESGEFIRLEKYYKHSGSDWHLSHTRKSDEVYPLSALSSWPISNTLLSFQAFFPFNCDVYLCWFPDDINV